MVFPKGLTAVQLDPAQHSILSRPINGKAVATHPYETSLAGANNQLIVAVIEDATHQYPNGTNHPVVMTDPLWPFFSRYSLP